MQLSKLAPEVWSSLLNLGRVRMWKLLSELKDGCRLTVGDKEIFDTSDILT